MPWLGLVAVACTSGQTGSPAEEPPRYESPDRLSPQQPPSGGTGNPGGMQGTNRPTYSREGGDLGALLDDTHLVLAVDRRGVLVFEVSDPSAPSLIGELPIDGRPFQFDLDTAARRATLAVEERTPFESDQIPDEAPVSRVRLIHVDLANPAQPRRVAHVDLDADFWQFVRREDRYFVLAQLYEPLVHECGAAATVGEWGPATRAMRVTSYALDADGFHEIESVELPTDGGYAWATENTFVTATRHQVAASDGPNALELVDFSSGSLRETQVEIDGSLIAVDRRGERLVALADRDGQKSLRTFAVTGAGTTALGTLALPAETRHVQLLGNGEQAVIRGDAATLVDLSAPESPRIAHGFPPDVQNLHPVPEGLLGIGRSVDSSTAGRVVVTLWDVAGSVPGELARVLTPWGAPQYDPGSEGYTIDAARSRLLLPIYVGNNLATGLGVATWDGTSVRVHSEQPSRETIYRPFAASAAAFSPGWTGLEVLPLLEGAAPEEPASAFVAFGDVRAIDALDARGFRLTLRERHDDGRFLLEVAASDHPSEVQRRLVLEHRADELVALGDRVLALGLRWDGECDHLEQDPADAQDGLTACADHRARGLSVIALDGEPRVVESIAIDSSLDAPVLPDVRTISTWFGYVQLEDGRLAFLAEQRNECGSQAGCDALGVMAGQTRAAPGCSTNQDCSMQPDEVIVTSGSQTFLLLYVLENADGDAPALRLSAQVEGRYSLPDEGSSLDIGWALLQSGADLGIAREEHLYDEQGKSLTSEHGDALLRYWLDRMVQREDGTFEALPSVNTPGIPVAWIGGAVYSVEPSYADGGDVRVRLHRSLIKDDGAFIQASTDLGRGYVDARAQGDQLFVLAGPEDPCDEDPSTRLFAIDLRSEELEAGDELVLPGRWAFVYGPTRDSDGALLLRGGPALQGHARIDVGDPGRPMLIGYRNE